MQLAVLTGKSADCISDLTRGKFETFEYQGKTLNARRVRNRKRAAKGQKANLQQNTLTFE